SHLRACANDFRSQLLQDGVEDFVEAHAVERKLDTCEASVGEKSFLQPLRTRYFLRKVMKNVPINRAAETFVVHMPQERLCLFEPCTQMTRHGIGQRL